MGSQNGSMTAFESGQQREIRLLSEENLDLKIKNLQQLGELHRLRVLVDKLQGLTAQAS